MSLQKLYHTFHRKMKIKFLGDFNQYSSKCLDKKCCRNVIICEYDNYAIEVYFLTI